MSTDSRSAALVALSRFLVTDTSLGETLKRVAEITVQSIPSAAFAGISMLDAEGRATTSVYTDDRSPDIDASQYASGRGPCLDAWRTQLPVRIDDMPVAAGDYPEFAAAAGEHGIESTLSLPLISGGVGIGALNLYARVGSAFTLADEEIGLEMAAAASVVFANASAYWGVFDLSEQLGEAMVSRAVIEQAKGVLMATTGCAPDAAFDLLRQQSQSENRKLRVVAEEIVDRQSRPRV
jgi:GAF domain-containing protein